MKWNWQDLSIAWHVVRVLARRGVNSGMDNDINVGSLEIGRRRRGEEVCVFGGEGLV